MTASRDWTARVWALSGGGGGGSGVMASASGRSPGGMTEADDGGRDVRCLSVLTGHGGPLTSLQVEGGGLLSA